MTSKKKYNSPISPKNINNIIILISIIILTIKLLIAYRFHNRINDEKLFNIQLLLVLFYYSVSTLGWSNDRLDSINVIVSKCIDLFIEYQGVFIADLLIIIVVHTPRSRLRVPRTTSQSNKNKNDNNVCVRQRSHSSSACVYKEIKKEEKRKSS